MPFSPEGSLHALSQWLAGNPVATFIIDAQHRVTHWNPACAALCGIPAEQIVGSTEQWRAFYNASRPTLADLVVDNAPDKVVATVLSLIAGLALSLSFAWSEARERERAVAASARAEAALRESEAYLAQIVDGSSVATLVIDAGHRVTHWNRACEAMTGTLARDVIGTDGQWKAFYPSKRPIMADLVLGDANENTVDRLYHGRFRPSLLIPGGYEAEDFFPHFGESGR